MPKSKARPPNPKIRSKEILFNAETSVTATDEPEEKKRTGRSQQGEKVEAPSAELQPHGARDWGKIGVILTLVLAGFGAIYHYADVVSMVKNTAEELKDIRRRTEDLLRASIEASARIGALERREAAAAPTPTLPPSAPTDR